jgi:DNA polymerase I-like protein with 3'-5' exonuclease and polymerase domains
MLKRRRPIPDIDARNPARQALAERMAINSVVQGSAADLIKLAMVELHAVFNAKGSEDAKIAKEEFHAEAPGSQGGAGIETQGAQGARRGDVGRRTADDPSSAPSSVFSGSVVRKMEASAWHGPPVKMLLQIHDELVFEAPEAAAGPAQRVIVERMQGAMQVDVPLIVESAVSKNWFEGK